MKNDKMKWYILIAVALLLGAIIGYFATSNLITEGNAKLTITKAAESPTKSSITSEELAACIKDSGSCPTNGIITTDCGCNSGGHYYSCGSGCGPTAYCPVCETHKFLWGAFQIS